MPLMDATDLERRYGRMVSLDELARFFHGHVRAIRNALEARNIPILTFGSSTVVPLRLVERAFGLESLAVDEDVKRHAMAQVESMYHPDGRRKSVREFTAEVSADMPHYLALLAEARREAGRDEQAAVAR